MQLLETWLVRIVSSTAIFKFYELLKLSALFKLSGPIQISLQMAIVFATNVLAISESLRIKLL